MATKKKISAGKPEIAKQQWEEKELKVKIKEFTKKYFAYRQTDPKVSAEAKQELERLGAFQPFYSDSEEERSIRLIKMWDSTNPEIKKMVLKAVGQHFLIKEVEQIHALLVRTKTYWHDLEARMARIKEARAKNKYE